MDADLARRITAAVDAGFARQTAFLSELTGLASTRGAEAAAQAAMAAAYRDRGYETDSWTIDHRDIMHLPGYSPVLAPYDNAVNVVGISRPQATRGRSLILNGHIDVVPAGPEAMWSRPPFSGAVDGDWLYGRGAGDMKAGLTANLFALDALAALGLRPAAPCYLQSVVEEECTGNGALACLQRGYRAAAAIIPEPFNEQLVKAQVGVLWLQVRLKGLPAHVAYAGAGVNAIEAMIPLIAALRALEQRLNDPARRPPEFAAIAHPINLNIGRIEGGDWPSSVPAWATLDLRIALYPGADLDAAEAELRACILAAAAQSEFLRANPPEIVNHGFRAAGYSLAGDDSPGAREAVATLARAHAEVNATPLEQIAITATTDARVLAIYGDTPSLVYGPLAERIHGYDERVSLASLRRVTRVIALFVADWCGLEAI